MSRICFPRTVAFVAVLVLAGGIALPAEHVHYAADADHPAVVHRHFSDEASTSTALHGPDDDHVQELRDAWLVGRGFVFPAVGAVALRPWDQLPPLARGEVVVFAALRVDHDPPLLPRVLRGPPRPV